MHASIDDSVASAIAHLQFIERLPLTERVTAINAIREHIHKLSPFASEPVDFVKWVPRNEVQGNDYNPNTVAPPEMELLRVSITADGYTQPIVANREGDKFEVVDGFHRSRVGKEVPEIVDRLHEYLPVVQIRAEQVDKGERIASTIRHNRARGKHRVEAMSEIVIELKRRNWTDEKIAKSLGMEQDEILRLCQISGLSELFSDQNFSKSWDVEGEITESDFQELSDEFDREGIAVRTVNTSDENRIFHTYDKWECYQAGFYNTYMDGRTDIECKRSYRNFLADEARFSAALEHVITEWKHSCEHYLTNNSMNRIAYLGQAAACYAEGLPSEFRAGFYLLSDEQQQRANEIALVYLNKWLVAHDRPAIDLDEALTGRQSDIY